MESIISPGSSRFQGISSGYIPSPQFTNRKTYFNLKDWILIKIRCDEQQGNFKLRVEIAWQGVGCIHSPQKGAQWQAPAITITKLPSSMKAREVVG